MKTIIMVILLSLITVSSFAESVTELPGNERECMVKSFKNSISKTKFNTYDIDHNTIVWRFRPEKTIFIVPTIITYYSFEMYDKAGTRFIGKVVKNIKHSSIKYNDDGTQKDEEITCEAKRGVILTDSFLNPTVLFDLYNYNNR